jgi:tripartite-type tricarboxylate transporter receptor subunit TctC
MCVSSNAVPAAGVKELISWLKENPGKISAGSNGAGSPQQVSALLFQKLTGTRFPFVPYRGSGPAMQDLVAGQITLMFESSLNVLPHARAGRVKAYAIMAKTRISGAPDLPTSDEVGLSGLYFSYWGGVWAPKGTPRPVVNRLNSALVDALTDPSVRLRLSDLGVEIPPGDQLRLRRSHRFSGSKSRSGGRSSRPPTSSRSKRALALVGLRAALPNAKAESESSRRPGITTAETGHGLS